MSVKRTIDNEGSVWLSSMSDLPGANDASLRRSLLTSDGRGVKFKEAVLDELLSRDGGAQVKEKREKINQKCEKCNAKDKMIAELERQLNNLCKAVGAENTAMAEMKILSRNSQMARMDEYAFKCSQCGRIFGIEEVGYIGSTDRDNQHSKSQEYEEVCEICEDSKF